MNPGLTISDEKAGAVQILHLSGYLDGHTFVTLERALEGNIASGLHRLVIDLAHLTYIASAGVGVFISAQSQVRKLGGNLQLVNPAPSVREVFGILGLEAIFTIHPSIDQGVQAAQR